MLNKIVIMGRLTANPEIRYTQTQKPVASFNVACERDYASGGEKKTDFISCTAWNATAEFIGKYFQKGSMIVASGRLESREWTDKEGRKRINWEINAEQVYFGESKKSGSTTQNEAPSGFHPIGDEDGDLPF